MIKFIIYLCFSLNSQQTINSVADEYINSISSFTNKAVILYFESTDMPRDGIIFTEKLMDEIVKRGKIKVVDPMMAAAKFKKFGIKSIGELDYDSTIKLSRELGSNYVIIGSVSRIEKVIESRGRIIKLPDLEVVKSMTHRVYPEWDSSLQKTFPLKKFDKEDLKDVKTSEECAIPQLVKIASEYNESKYSFVCAEFSCKMVDCSKYPTVKQHLYKIYFKDPRKKVVVVDDSFNLLEEYSTNEK